MVLWFARKQFRASFQTPVSCPVASTKLHGVRFPLVTHPRRHSGVQSSACWSGRETAGQSQDRCDDVPAWLESSKAVPVTSEECPPCRRRCGLPYSIRASCSNFQPCELSPCRRMPCGLQAQFVFNPLPESINSGRSLASSVFCSAGFSDFMRWART